MNIEENLVIGKLVAQDYRTASVFTKYGIDFCCRGDKTIGDACAEKNVNSKEVLAEIIEIQLEKTIGLTDYSSWPLNVLADHIEKKHHLYVQEKTAEILPNLEIIFKKHGGKHPELLEIRSEFSLSAKELAAHMKKEELILFPFIRKMVKAKQNGSKLNAGYFGTVRNPISSMMDDHTVEGERFIMIKALSNNYTPPEDACATFKVTFALLQEFEQDLHLHIHLENNILFPKTIEMEKELI